MEQNQKIKKHSRIVGGSTAKRVMACPGSVALCTQVPPRPSTRYADEGTLLHEAASICLDEDKAPASLVGMTSSIDGLVVELTEEMVEEKLRPALNAFDDYLTELDPDQKLDMDYAVEQEVSFGKYLPEVFGSCDVIARVGDVAVVLDWKFGSGVAVEAEENEQLMFYAAAARRTKALDWFFDGVTEIELVIIQPPTIKRWRTTTERIDRFEQELKQAVKLSASADAPMKEGDHCRWCAAKAICPLMTGAVDRALSVQLREVDITRMGRALKQADLLEQWIDDLRTLAHQALEAGVAVPGWKLVDKRATRKWRDEEKAREALAATLAEYYMQTPAMAELLVYEEKIYSPAKMEKLFKKNGLELPEELIVKESSGTTIAPDEDPRPAALLIGQQLTKALGRLDV